MLWLYPNGSFFKDFRGPKNICEISSNQTERIENTTRKNKHRKQTEKANRQNKQRNIKEKLQENISSKQIKKTQPLLLSY